MVVDDSRCRTLSDSGDIGVLVKAHQDGDPLAFGLLLERFKADLWGYLVNHIQRRHDAEDLYQEISLKLLKNLGRLKDPDKFRSWLFAIAVNAVRTFFRRKPFFSIEGSAGDDGGSAAGFEPADQKETPEAGLARKQQLETLRRCLMHLPVRDREVLLLDTMAELPQQEIAAQLGLNLNTVKTILRRTRIKLARMMIEVAHEQ